MLDVVMVTEFNSAETTCTQRCQRLVRVCNKHMRIRTRDASVLWYAKEHDYNSFVALTHGSSATKYATQSNEDKVQPLRAWRMLALERLLAL